MVSSTDLAQVLVQEMGRGLAMAPALVVGQGAAQVLVMALDSATEPFSATKPFTSTRHSAPTRLMVDAARDAGVKFDDEGFERARAEEQARARAS